MATEKRKLTVWAVAQLARLNVLGFTRLLIEGMPDATHAKPNHKTTITIRSTEMTFTSRR